MKLLFASFFSLFFALSVVAQDTTQVAPPSDADSLLASLTDSVTSPELLPKKMTISQRLLWSRKGVLRSTGIAPLTAESREKELKVRRAMLVSHQVVGFVTLAGMITQGILGSRLYKAQGADYVRLKNAHENVATFINISYGTAALLAFTSPPRLPTSSSRRRGFSSIQLHKTLAMVHLTGMIATNILARQISGSGENYDTLKSAHRIAAFTTFAAFGAAIVAIKF